LLSETGKLEKTLGSGYPQDRRVRACTRRSPRGPAQLVVCSRSRVRVQWRAGSQSRVTSHEDLVHAR